MLFVCQLDIIPGKAKEAVRLLKNTQTQPGVEVKQSLGLLGKPDALVIFTAPSEGMATKFVLQFSPAMVTRTSLAFPVTEF